MKILKLISLFIIVNLGSLAFGSWLMGMGASSQWYRSLNKAYWEPEGWVFGLAWTTIMICFSIYLGFLSNELIKKNNLRICSAGGSSLPIEVLKDFEKRFKVAILEGYGLSETSPGITFNHLGRERKPGSVGQPVWGIEIKVVDENDEEVKTKDTGEIIVRGHAVMKGYYNNSEGTKNALKNGWFYTADIGYYDEDGYL